MADDAAGRDSSPGVEQYAEGLRERKKRLTRQLLSDTATAMFLERGFDGFKITEVAEACGVSEKTVYNYFPTKESLILDREGDVAAAIRQALRPEATTSPVDAIVEVLAAERQQMREGLAELGGEEAGLAMFRRFMTAIDETPSVRAAAGEMAERLAGVAAEALAARAGVSPDDPEPLIAGRALVGLWLVQRSALRRDAAADASAADVYARANDEVRRAGRLIDTGLWSFSVMASGRGSREQLHVAAEAAQKAARQVAAALRDARKMWAEMQSHDAPAASGGAGRAREGATAGDRAPWWMGGEADAPWWMGGPPSDQEWSREDRQRWREQQREHVQRWRASQREHSAQWRDAVQALKQERREATRRMKQELKDAALARAEEIRESRRNP